MKRKLLLFLTFALSLSVFADDDISYDYPDIPLLEIYTQDMVEPTCERIDAPSGCFGNTITNNEYVFGNMKVWMNHEVVYSSYGKTADEYGMKLKIRGNSTGAFMKQRPYKIKLGKKADLFFTGDPLAENKEWVLLDIGVWNTQFTNALTDLTTLLGACVSRCLGTPWTPRYRFVNLVMNGTYRGCYVLAEAVGRSDGRINTKKTGFVLEYDAYWWKPDEEYFKTDHCHSAMAFTFKYPEDEAITDSVKTLYRDYLNDIEQYIYDPQAEVDDRIDYTSFARWLLIHDILGTSDAAGSNIFLYKESMDPKKPTASLLKMGPTWDYGACFKVGNDEMSVIHDMALFYFNELIHKPLFFAEYHRLWQDVKDRLYDDVSNYFDSLLAAEGEAIDQSFVMSHKLYKQEYLSLTNQRDEILEKLKLRLQSLDNLINIANAIRLPEATPQDANGFWYDITGRRLQGKPKGGIYIKGGKKVKGES